MQAYAIIQPDDNINFMIRLGDEIAIVIWNDIAEWLHCVINGLDGKIDIIMT